MCKKFIFQNCSSICRSPSKKPPPHGSTFLTRFLIHSLTASSKSLVQFPWSLLKMKNGVPSALSWDWECMTWYVVDHKRPSCCARLTIQALESSFKICCALSSTSFVHILHFAPTFPFSLLLALLDAQNLSRFGVVSSKNYVLMLYELVLNSYVTFHLNILDHQKYIYSCAVLELQTVVCGPYMAWMWPEFQPITTLERLLKVYNSFVSVLIGWKRATFR